MAKKREDETALVTALVDAMRRDRSHRWLSEALGFSASTAARWIREGRISEEGKRIISERLCVQKKDVDAYLKGWVPFSELGFLENGVHPNWDEIPHGLDYATAIRWLRTDATPLERLKIAQDALRLIAEDMTNGAIEGRAEIPEAIESFTDLVRQHWRELSSASTPIPSLAKLKAGKDPSRSDIVLVAHVLNLDVEDLIGLSNRHSTTMEVKRNDSECSKC